MAVKDEKLRQLMFEAVRSMLTLEPAAYEDVVVNECTRVGTEIGNLMSSQLVGSRNNGPTNAVSSTIRLLNEAIFWLNYSNVPCEKTLKSVTALRDFMVSPGISE